MKELIEFLAKSLVEHPDAVAVTEVQRGALTVYHLAVDPSDLGKVIGRQGRIARAIRHVVSAAAHRQNRRVALEITGR